MSRLRYGQTTKPDPNNADNVIVSGPCFVTKKQHSVSVPLAGLLRWLEGDELIQSALPQLSSEEREFLISGTSPEGWKQMFGDDPEDEEEDDVSDI